MSGAAVSSRHLLLLQRTIFVNTLAGETVPAYGKPRAGAVFIDPFSLNQSKPAAARLDACTFRGTNGSDVGLSEFGMLFVDEADERFTLNAVGGAERRQRLSEAGPNIRFLGLDDPELAALRKVCNLRTYVHAERLGHRLQQTDCKCCTRVLCAADLLNMPVDCVAHHHCIVQNFCSSSHISVQEIGLNESGISSSVAIIAAVVGAVVVLAALAAIAACLVLRRRRRHRSATQHADGVDKQVRQQSGSQQSEQYGSECGYDHLQAQPLSLGGVNGAVTPSKSHVGHERRASGSHTGSMMSAHSVSSSHDTPMSRPDLSSEGGSATVRSLVHVVVVCRGGLNHLSVWPAFACLTPTVVESLTRAPCALSDCVSNCQEQEQVSM